VNIIQSQKQERSQKPDDLYPIIEACSPGPYLELFARHRMRIAEPQSRIEGASPDAPQKRKNLLLIRSLIERTRRRELEWHLVFGDEVHVRDEHANALATTIDTEAIGEISIQVIEKSTDYPDAHGYYENEMCLVLSSASEERRGIRATHNSDPTTFRELTTLLWVALVPIEDERVKKEADRLRRKEKDREALERSIDEIIGDGGLTL
jgi:hypothetical protein